nr:MAG TPA: hypothetical protein [Caudoviricetes sp.]DAL48789.1 MAG TPA_asm: hypothetical protein [Caudoviricetes sp.]DAT27377.1 MAG TPA: hypothetical protein [Caudoviricetes sp.]
MSSHLLVPIPNLFHCLNRLQLSMILSLLVLELDVRVFQILERNLHQTPSIHTIQGHQFFQQLQRSILVYL